GVGYYRKTFNIPASKKGKEVFIYFMNVETECTVWVNGKKAGYHKNRRIVAGEPWRFHDILWLDDFELNITPYIKEGKNVITLRVFDDGLPKTGKNADDGGITAPVHIEFREKAHIEKLYINPILSKSSIEIDFIAKSYSGKDKSLTVKAVIAPFGSRFYKAPVKAEAQEVSLGSITFTSKGKHYKKTIKIKDPILWDLNTPFIYHLRLTSAKKTLGQDRFGMREFTTKNRKFYLNGHPVYLLGLNVSNNQSLLPRMAFHNKANMLRYALKIYKDANFVVMRVHTGPYCKIFYDICDELGLLVQHGYSPTSVDLKPEEITRAEMIELVHVDNYFKPDGTFTGKFKKLLSKFILKYHNHPSLVMIDGGNELGYNPKDGSEKMLVKYMERFYDHIKEQDRQKRLITPTSGLAVWMWKTPVRADFHDFHCYASWVYGWANAMRMNKEWVDYYQRLYPEITVPLVNSETVGHNMINTVQKELTSLFTSGKLNKKKYVKWANKIRTDRKYNVGYWELFPKDKFVRFNGIRGVRSKAAILKSGSYIIGNEIRIYRRDADYLEGMYLHDIDVRIFGYKMTDTMYTELKIQNMYKQAKKSLPFKTLENNFAPQVALLDMYDRHINAGETFKTKVYVINDLYKTPEKELTVAISIKDAKGKTIGKKELVYKKIPEKSRQNKKLSIPIPQTLATGDYSIHTQLYKGKKLLNEQKSLLYIMGQKTAGARIKTKKKIALYDVVGSKFQGMGVAATQTVMDSFGLRYTQITDFKKLSSFDVLIIGANSIDANLKKDAHRITSYVNNGGKVICFEQEMAGPIPFLPDMKYKSADDMFFADIIDSEHPVVKDFKSWHFELWNGERQYGGGGYNIGPKAVYNTYILPMMDGVVLAGAHTGGIWINPVFGTVAGEVKVGKGLIFFSQAQATKRAENDPVAMQFIKNILSYALGSKWTGGDIGSIEVKTDIPKINIDTVYVDISGKANRTFYDEMEDDKKGGWTDQGPKNDIREIPKGEMVLRGIPYKVIDDKGGKNALMITWGEQRTYFPKKISDIQIGKKFKKLAFLHCTAWTAGHNDANVGKYKIIYSDGSTVNIDLIVGKNINDAWNPVDLKEAKVAVTFKNEVCPNLGMYSFIWVNPKPGKVIKSIDIITSGKGPMIACAAITGVK
ncbi:glycoside hydrolase family 2 protein, partial [Spirochaetota bacterium]